MRLRQKKGGTLALIVAATIILIMLGICFFFLAQIFGGEREIQHATDSGNLNVAKNALRRPSVTLKDGLEKVTFGQLGDPGEKNEVNLLTYNRLMAQALLICLNADKSDNGDPTTGAKAHAVAIVNALQNGPESIGGRLSKQLSDQSSANPLLANYSATADKNSLRMLGASSFMGRVDSEYKVAYLENKAIDPHAFGATNIELGNSDPIPSALLSQYKVTKEGPDGNQHDYLKGYIQPGIGSVAVSPVGVPLQPGDQPHLVSNKTFADQINKPCGNAVFVPPNGFKSTATAKEERSNLSANTVACSLVGSLNLTFQFAVPYGYIMVVNGPDGVNKPDSVPGPFVGLDHVLNNELLGGGINLSGPVFSTDQTALDNWAKYNASRNATPPVSCPQPTTDGIFKLDGTPARPGDCQNIPYTGTPTDASAVTTQCTDRNSTGWSRDDAGVVSKCWDALNSGAFDKAYHPDGSYTTGSTQPAGGLLAVECAKCQLQHRFNACTNLTVDSGNCPTTGLRTNQPQNVYGHYYSEDWRTSESPSTEGSCQISKDDTIHNLGEWVQTGFGTKLDNWLTERCKQICPKDGLDQYNNCIKHKTLPIGGTYYIWARNVKDIKPGSSTSATLDIDTTAPPWMPTDTNDPTKPKEPDGKKIEVSNTYNIVLTAVNPHHDRGIHDQMYTETPASGINGTDYASWTPSSGFGNLLGKVQFTESASGTAGGFCKPD